MDVAYSTVVTAELREFILKQPWPEHSYRLPRAEYEAQVNRIYGPVGPSCVALQDKVGLYRQDMVPLYRSREQEIRQILSQMPSAEQIRQMLAAVGLDMAEFYKLYSPEKIADAKLYAKELKDRYTVLWLYYDLFGGNE